MFMAALREHFLPAIADGAFSGTPARPRRLLIHRLTGGGIYSLTWNFSSPDGRATFHLESGEGEPLLVWRRIGDHSITTSLEPREPRSPARSESAGIRGRD